MRYACQVTLTGVGIPNQGVSQTTRVAEELLERIRAGRYEVGGRLPSERSLAEEFGVSRPVVREALRMLVMLQVVDIQVGRGAFVLVEPDVVSALPQGEPVDLLDVIDVREIIETGALRLAHQRASAPGKRGVSTALRNLERAVDQGHDTTDLDRRFHEAIVTASQSPMLLQVWRGLEREIALSIRVSPKGRFMGPDILDQHRRVASGVTGGSLDDALSALADQHADNRAFVRELARQERASGKSKRTRSADGRARAS